MDGSKTSGSRAEDIQAMLVDFLIGEDPLTFSKCRKGHRLYPMERKTGVCLRCAAELRAFLNDTEVAGAAGR